MKYLCVIVFLHIFYREVTSGKTKEVFTLEADAIDYGPGKNYIDAGANVKINCEGSSRSRKLEWYDSAGNPVSHQLADRVKVQENISTLHQRSQGLVLMIDEAAVTDTGVWKCQAGDLIDTVSVCVLDPLKFVDSNTVKLQVDEGRAISLSCQVKGEPEPNIYWYRNGIALNEETTSNKYRIVTNYKTEGFEGLLIIKSLTPDDAGVYTCIAKQEIPIVENCSKTESYNITLYINHGPSFTTEKVEHYFLNENKSLDLVCTADGFPPPTYRWFHETGPMFKEYAEKQIQFTEIGAVLKLVGGASVFGQSYQCKASNSYGETYKKFVVHKLDKPLTPTGMDIFNYTDTKIQFNATWDDDVPFPVTKFQIQYFKKDTRSTPKEFRWQRADHISIDVDGDFNLEETILTLEDLQPETEYWVRVRVVNEVGYSSWTAPLLGSTSNAEEEILVVPQPLIPGDPMFYGAILTVVIIISGVACMMIIKSV